VATALRALDPSEDLDEDEQGRQVGELSLRRQVLLESLQEAGLPRRVEVGRVLPERESPKGEGPGAGVQSLVELAGGADVDLANVPRALLRPRLLDDVEVAVSPAVAEFEGPLHFDAMPTGNASGYLAVAVGIASLPSPSTEGKVVLGYLEAHSDAMLFPMEEELPTVKSGEDQGGAVLLGDKPLAQAEGDGRHDLRGELVHVVEVTSAAEGGDLGEDVEEGAGGPPLHTVLADGLVGAAGEEGEQGRGGGAAPGDLLDGPGEPQGIIGGEDRRRGAEGVGQELEAPETALGGSGEAVDHLVLGPEVDLGGGNGTAQWGMPPTQMSNTQ
jgi:hypothetical protein